VLVYAGVLCTIVAAAAFTLWARVPLKVDVIRDRAVISREVHGGRIENVYRLQIMNIAEAPQRFEIHVKGLPTLHVSGDEHLTVDATSSRMVPVRVRIDAGAADVGTHPIWFVISAEGKHGVEVREKSVFVVR
jgi:polyferredoxin